MIYPYLPQDSLATDSVQSTMDPSIIATTEDPAGRPDTIENSLDNVMLSNDKLYVVLAVVLIIWFGFLYLLFNTDRKIKALENQLNENKS